MDPIADAGLCHPDTIGEFDLYVPKDETGAFKAYDSPGDSYADTLEVMRGLVPSHVVFNGAKGALTGDGLRGASTITQQLARNLFPDDIGNSASVTRKIREAITARKIEGVYTKDEILELYLNTVPFLYNAHGIEMAARTYFSTSADDLDRLQAATLVGMLKGTSSYNPYRHPERALARRNVVLGQMVRFGDLPEAAPQPAEILDGRLLIAVLALAGAVGWLFKLAKFPAAFLLGAMAVSAVLHGAEIVTAAVPPWMTIAAFIALGSMIGTRFSGTTFAELKRSMAAGVFVTIASVAIAALFALLAAYLTGFPVPSVLIAFAPGGLETMVAMSVLLGSDPTFVAAHHVARLLMLTMIIPLFLIRGKRN